jgi:hypothetical protein
MKSIKYLFVALAFALGSLSLTSCGGDEITDIDGPGELEQGWKESGNTMTYSASYSLMGVSSSFVYTFTFSGDVCTKATYAFTYPTEEQAQMDWDNMWEEDKAKATLNGRTITEDVTDEYEGLSKEEIRGTIE